MAKEDNLINAFVEAYHLMHRYNMMWYGRNFGGIDPKQGQGRILTALRRMHSITQKELGLSLDIRPQSLGELLQKLEANGYIKRYHAPTDKRALLVELTEKGEVFQLTRPEYEELFVDLDPEERKILEQALLKISERLTDLIDKEMEEYYYY